MSEASTKTLWQTINAHKDLISNLDKRVDINKEAIERQHRESKEDREKMVVLETRMIESNTALANKIGSILTIGKTLMWVIPITGVFVVSAVSVVVWLYSTFSTG